LDRADHPLMAALALATLLLAITVWHAFRRRSIERAVAARLPVGPSGIVAGAEPIYVSARSSLPSPPAPSTAALLLLHGFGDTPQALGQLARELAARGYTVLAPLLPGHGRSLREFRDSGEAMWVGAARQALAEVRQRASRVGIVGLSMGGAIAVTLAATYPAEVAALALLAPYLEAPGGVRLLARMAPVAGLLLPYLDSRDPRSIHDPVARERALGYGVSTPRLVAELVRLADHAREALPKVTAPTLYVQSREDNRLLPEGAARAFARLGARTKRLEWLSGCGHVITVDYGWPHVAQLVGEWMDEVLDPEGRRDAREPGSG
jgi:carboxylesterase